MDDYACPVSQLGISASTFSASVNSKTEQFTRELQALDIGICVCVWVREKKVHYSVAGISCIKKCQCL